MGVNTLSSAVMAERVDPFQDGFELISLTLPNDKNHGLLSFYHDQANDFGSTDSIQLDESDSIFSRSVSSNTNCDPFLLPLCAGCGKQIKDQYLLRVSPNLEWHIGCLKCTDCGQHLDETDTCFVKEGKAYCKRDYIRLFGSKCSKCGEVFAKNDFVMRASDRIYHIDCFRCVACNKQLIPGDTFALRHDGLLCKTDHDNAIPHDHMEENNSLRHTPEFSSVVRGASIGLSPSSAKGINTPTGGKQGGDHRNSSCSQKRKDAKTTRVRTVLNEKQLHTLRTCYAANCRPDALMKEQLTEMTGLSARVIRVWFQNKRCKDKKRSLALKQMHNRQAKRESNGEQGGNSCGLKGLASINGVTMETADPARTSPVTANAIEMQNHQKPAWKVLSDFTLQSEIEQPAFQQFMSHFSDPGQSSVSDLSEICSIPSVSSASFDASTTCSTPLFPEMGASACC